MSRTLLTTGGININSDEKKLRSESSAHNGGNTASADMPMHIAILADFSGRSSQNNCQAEQIHQRKLIEINRDNFDQIFASLAVSLQLPVAEQPLKFQEFDDLHPDYIYDRIALFDKLRILKRKLKKRDSFTAAAEEISTWAEFRNQNAREPEQEGIPLPDDFLETLLNKQSHLSALDAGPLGNIDNLIKDIISPFVEPKADPRQTEMLAAVDHATSQLMRKIMHSSDFQQLEASWRALYFLIRRIESQTNIKVFIADISQEEIAEDFSQATDLHDSKLYRLLVEQRQSLATTPFSLIIGDYELTHTTEDAELASGFSAIAQSTHATWFSAGHEEIAGCHSFCDTPDASEWNTPDSIEAWSALRQSAQARHLALTAPRFMLRLPYGNKTTTMENFEFEELSSPGSHNYYLWGNSAYLAALLLLQSHAQYNWAFRPGKHQEVENMPLHVYQSDGDTIVKPCAEILLTDLGARTLQDAGLLPVRSVNAKDAVLIPTFNSVALDNAPIRGPWLS